VTSSVKMRADLGHVDRGAARWGCAAGGWGAQHLLAAQRGDDLAGVTYGVDRDAVDDLRLGGAGIGDDNAAHADRAGEHRGHKDAADGAHGAVEAELAENEQVGERVGRDGALGGLERPLDPGD
jgi:hypothetical protein